MPVKFISVQSFCGFRLNNLHFFADIKRITYIYCYNVDCHVKKRTPGVYSSRSEPA